MVDGKLTTRLRYVEATDAAAEHIPTRDVEGCGFTNDSYAAMCQRDVNSAPGHALCIFPSKFFTAPDGALYGVPDFARHAAYSVKSGAYI